MATHTRTRSTTLSGPHTISLKVLRLSRPSLATQTPLPSTSPTNPSVSPSASLAHPSANTGSSFPLTPLLTLPAAFGAAYVGETFTCTLCANSELQGSEGERKSVSNVRIAAELQTPGHQAGIALGLERAGGEEEEEDEDGQGDLKPGETMQRTLRHELKEEGPHVLVVTVTYTETLRTASGDAATAGRARTFRKLYQFVSQQLLAVRSKVTEREREKGVVRDREWILEAQLENVGEASVVLEKVWLKEREGIRSRPVNGDAEKESIVLKPSDVEQVMFLLAEEKEVEEGGGRVPLGQLNIDWRSAMGEKGSLTTGWLASRGR